MASVRVTGFKGVGFITPDDGSEDLFVHQAGNVPTAATAVGATAAVSAYAATGEEATAATGEAATAAAVAEVSPATSAARRATWQGAAPREAAAAVAASATSATRRATSPATAPTGARRCATVASDPTEPHVGSRPPPYLSKDLKNELEELSKWVSDDEYSSSLLEQINIDNLDVDDLCSNGRDVCFLAKLNEMGDGTIRRTLNNRSWKEKRSFPEKLFTRKIFHYLKDGKRVKEVTMNEYSLAGGPKDKVLCHIILSRQVASSPSEENTDGMMLRSRRLPRNEVPPLAGHKAMPGRSLLVALKNSEANGGMPSVSADGCGGTAGESNNNFKVSQQEAIRVKEELRKEVECLRVELKQVTDDRDHSVIQLNRLNIEFGNSKEQIGKTSEECERFRTKVSELEETCNVQQQQIQTFQKQLAVATEKLKLADVTAIEAMTGYEEQKEKIKYLEERLAQAESHILEGDELRKKLHNTILELKGNIRVFCRVRPLLPSDGDSNGPEGASISFPTSVESAGRGIDLINQGQKLSFSYDKVFDHDASQEEVFLEISQLVQSALDGYKVCIFAYGQSGSGKTYTMMGKPGIDQKGIIPRSLEQIFKASRFLESQGCNYSMHASMLEIYNETIRDLLAPKKYNIKHDHHGNMNVSQLQVFGISDVTNLLEKALESRSVGKTQMNEQSSRSHFVFTLKLSGTNKKTGQLVEGVLNLIDLAGNESLGESGSTGDRLKETQVKETQSINKSLSALSDVICAIATRAKHVPFRNSKLTFLLQPCLEGDSKALMFVNISPESSSIDKTIRSLRFAERVNACEIGKPRRQTKARPND